MTGNSEQIFHRHHHYISVMDSSFLNEKLVSGKVTAEQGFIFTLDQIKPLV